MTRHRSHKHRPRRIAHRNSKKRVVIPGRIRRVVPGAVWLITKKCTDDLFLLRPDPGLNRFLLYSLLYWSSRRGVRIHAFCFMSNHFHLVITDVEGKLPALMRDFLSETSKAIQVGQGIDRPIWSRRRYSAIRLLDLNAAERMIVYTHLNPLRAGLTEPEDWPGLTTARFRFGETIRAKRPAGYFSKRRPEWVSMDLESSAKSFGSTGGSESCARIREMLDEKRGQIHANLRRKGRALAGADKVSRTSREKRGRRKEGGKIPRFATLDPNLMALAVAEEAAFQERHAAALTCYLERRVDTIFPHGTYGYHELLGVRVEDGSSAA